MTTLLPRLRRCAFAAIALVLVASLAAPDAVGAESTRTARQRREQTRSKRAKAAAQLNALKATDAQLEAAVRTLSGQVQAEQSKVEAERRRVSAAEEALARAVAKVEATRRHIDQLRHEVVDRAVAAYVRPQGDVFTGLVTARDFNDASRRTTMLAQVANRGQDAIDQLRAVKEDFETVQAEQERVRQLARSRRQAVALRLEAVRQARDEKSRMETALDKRIRELQHEIDEMAASEGALSSLIRANDIGKVSGSGLVWPTRGRLTSGFGRRWGRLHAGIDIAAPRGTRINAAKAGTVIFAGTMRGYGNVVVISHGGGFSTLYAHQSRIAARRGAQVGRGQLIGYVGSTGRSTGNHLHFETRLNGSPQNPRRYLS